MFITTSVFLFSRSSDSPPHPEPHNTTILNLFFAFQLFGLGGLAIILFTAAITRTWKHPSWVNFCVTWIISCISYSLLVGRPITYVPPHQLCLAQAVLIYTVPTLTASATLALVIHVFRMVGSRTEGSEKLWTIMLVIYPYLAASGMMAFSLIVGLRDPQTVRRIDSGLYCNMGNDLPGKISAAVVTIIMLICIILEVLVSRDVKRQWTLLRHAASSNGSRNSRHSRHSRDSRSSHNLHADGTTETTGEGEGRLERISLIAMTMKVLVFSAFSVFAVVLGIVFTFTPHHTPALNIVLSLIPVVAVLVFGTQRDLILAWISGFRRIGGLVRPGTSKTRKAHWTRRCHGSTESQEKMIPDPNSPVQVGSSEC